MARKRKTSDQTYNARRRYRRQAERYADRAERTTGNERSRLMTLAQRAFAKAMETYDKATSKIGASMARVAARIGADAVLPETRGVAKKDLSTLTAQSMDALKSREDTRQQRNRQARDLLNTGNIGSRFFAMTKDAWYREDEYKTPPDQVIPRILEYFGADDIAEVMEQIDDSGIDLYGAPENDSMYMDIVAAGRLYVASIKNNR